MKQPVRDAFKQHYDQHELSLDQLARLNQLVSEHAAPTPRRAFWTRRSVGAGAVAVAALLMLVMHFFGPAYRPMPERIAAEVTKNHLKMRPLEVKSQSMTDIQRYFTELDFMPTRSSVFGMADQRLLGARYCSIQGVMAAQLRYEGDDTQMVTLYEAPYDPTLFSSIPNVDSGQTPLSVYSRGMKVTMWVEKDVLMVSAGAK